MRFPLRTLRQAASRAQSASGSVVTIGLLGDTYTLPTTDLDWGGGGVLSFTAKKQINLTGFKRDDSATSTGGVVENRTVVGIQGLGGPLSISARDTSVLVRGLEFDMAVSPMLNFDAMRGSKVALSDNTFTREKTQPATGELVVFESFENGIGIVSGNRFYFRGFAGNVVEHVALNIQNNGTARQQVVGNKFYYPLITQFNNSAGSVWMPFVGVKMWGSYMDVVGNSFAIDADRFAGQTPTSASRMIAGLRVMFGDNNKITDNSFAGFWGTPMVIETPIKSPLPITPRSSSGSWPLWPKTSA